MIVYLKKSNKSGKKWMVKIDNKTIHFGAKGMSDYTIHKDKDRMKRYVERHKKKENWKKSGIKTAGFWSRWLLWNKPSFNGSKSDISKRFGVKFSSKWSDKKSKSVKKSKSGRRKKSVKKSKSGRRKKSVKKSKSGRRKKSVKKSKSGRRKKSVKKSKSGRRKKSKYSKKKKSRK
jgi:hypothetical protein